MTNYVKSTNFASKDALAIGNPLKIVKGTEIDTEFNNIATAVATKADLASPVLTGTPSAPTAAPGTNTTQIATTAFVNSAVTTYDAALTVSTAQIEDDAVTAAKIAAGAVGNSELASDSVTQAKMADNSVGTAEIINANVTAAKLDGAQSGSAPVYGARAWVNFDGTGTVGTNQTIRASGNVASVYKNSAGNYTITFTTAMPDANYGLVGTAKSYTTDRLMVLDEPNGGTRTANSIQIRSGVSGSDAQVGFVADSSNISITIFR